MMTKYQVESKLRDGEWLEDHLPFNTENEAIEYIKTQPKCFQYRIISYEEPETAEEWLDFNDAWDAIGGDWQG
jgi:hypothetical protein